MKVCRCCGLPIMMYPDEEQCDFCLELHLGLMSQEDDRQDPRMIRTWDHSIQPASGVIPTYSSAVFKLGKLDEYEIFVDDKR